MRVNDAAGLGRTLIDLKYLPESIKSALLNARGLALYPTTSTANREKTGLINMVQCGDGKLYLYTRVYKGEYSTDDINSISDRCYAIEHDQWKDEYNPIWNGGGTGHVSGSHRYIYREINY